MQSDIRVSSKESYKSIFKANTLFGGVQVFQILVSIVKSKFVAVLLGPIGIGLLGLYASAIELVKSLTNLGLSQSAVRDVSEAYGTGNSQRIGITITIVNRLVWVTGIIGTVTAIIFSPLLSRTTFGNNDYIIPIIILSVSILIDQLCSGQKVILQGTRRLKDLAKATAYGSTIGLIISVPLYFWLGVKGIVPTLVLNSIISLLLTWYYSRRIKVEKVSINPKITITEGKNMLIMGLSMSVSNILITFSAYLLRSFINNIDGTEAVGLYTAGFTIVTTYFSMIFTAMSTDYYPRLAAVNKDNKKCRQLANEQGEVASLIMTPLLLACIIFMPLIINVLYSNKFLDANNFILWAVLGMLFKLASWVIAFQFIAKSESKLYIINESLLNAYTLALSLLGYNFWGLTGLGVAYSLSNVVYFVQVYLIAKIRYSFSFSKQFTSLMFLQNVLVIFSLIVVKSMGLVMMYFLGGIILILSCIISFKGLESRTGFATSLKAKIFNK